MLQKAMLKSMLEVHVMSPTNLKIIEKQIRCSHDDFIWGYPWVMADLHIVGANRHLPLAAWLRMLEALQKLMKDYDMYLDLWLPDMCFFIEDMGVSKDRVPQNGWWK